MADEDPVDTLNQGTHDPAPSSSESTPPPSPPAEDAAAPPATPSFSIREHLGKSGYDTSAFETDEAAAQALLGTVEEFHKNRSLIDQGRLYSQHAADFNRWLEQQQSASSGTQRSQGPASGGALQPPEPAKPSFDWKVPEYDPKWERLCEMDAHGRWKPLDGAPELAPYAQKLNTFADFQRDAAQRIVTDFPNLVQQALGGRFEEFQGQIDKMVNERVQSAIEQWEASRQTRQYLDQQKPKLYQLDDQGQIKRDPTTGAEALTPRGLAFVAYAQEAQKLGIATQDGIRTYVERLLAADEAQGKFGTVAPASAAPNGTPAPEPQVGVAAGVMKRRRFLGKMAPNTRTPDRSGTIPSSNSPADALQNPDATPDELFDEEMRKAGVKPPA